MVQGIIHVEYVRFCIYSDDPGCLGYPSWIDHPDVNCQYEKVECHFCDCGGSDVYGEMGHYEDCPLFKNAA